MENNYPHLSPQGLKRLREEVKFTEVKTALETILDQIDYTSGNCRPNELIAAVLPTEIIKMARKALSEEDTTNGK